VLTPASVHARLVELKWRVVVDYINNERDLQNVKRLFFVVISLCTFANRNCTFAVRTEVSTLTYSSHTVLKHTDIGRYRPIFVVTKINYIPA